MIGNVVILGIAVSIIWYVVKVCRTDLLGKLPHAIAAFVLTTILIFSIIIPNIEFIKSPFTPEINGKVVDAETNKPIEGAIVIVDWYFYFGEFPMHSRLGSDDQVIIFTDSGGYFVENRRLKSLAINLFPIYNKELSDIRVTAIHKDYQIKSELEEGPDLLRIKKTRYASINEIIKDNIDLLEMAKIRRQKGYHDIANRISKIVAEQDKTIKGLRGQRGVK